MSQNPVDIPDSLPKSVSYSSEQPEQLYRRLTDEGAKHLYIDGGNTIQRFLQAGLIDEMIITLIPILIGQGIPLFGPLQEDIRFKQVSSRAYDFGFVQLTLQIESKSADCS